MSPPDGGGVTPTAPAEDDDFDWSVEDDLRVIHEQPATAVYTNPRGQVVIRQQMTRFDGGVDEDQYVWFSLEHIPALIDALEAYVCEPIMASREPDRHGAVTGDANAVTPNGDASERHVTPAALRQRRYRKRRAAAPTNP